ncbi:hypothetical protein FG379_002496 [Cryptosporidium bovis]|uniref:uncharacterized protein n=1 Tax=Cryptosporidium bovis TaxID=310047 RepID=UPI003519FCE7|nr:hypothetical protein FG379_002496 [Cryptosporidium bovis]
MSIRRRDEILVIYIKLSLQLLCILGIFALLIKKEWIIGNKENTEIIIYGDLDEFCIRGGVKLLPSNSLVDFGKQGIQKKTNVGKVSDNIDNSLFVLENSGGDLDLDGLYSSVYSHKKNGKSRKMTSELEALNAYSENNELKKQKKITFKQNQIDLSFNSVQYCTNYLKSNMLKGWYIHPNYLYYVNLLFVFVSMVMSLNLTRLKNKWSTFELMIPGLDFASFTVSLLNVVQVIGVLTPLIDHFERTKYHAYFSTNFVFACVSIGISFVVFSLCVGIIHYRYEAFIRFKRFEDHIENIQSSSSFIHIISNK